MLLMLGEDEVEQGQEECLVEWYLKINPGEWSAQVF